MSEEQQEKRGRGRPKKGSNPLNKNNSSDLNTTNDDISSEENSDDQTNNSNENEDFSNDSFRDIDIDINKLDDTISDELPNDDYDPLDDVVKKRDYTSGTVNSSSNVNNQTNVSQEYIPEPEINQNNTFIEDAKIIEPKGKNEINNTSSQNEQSGFTNKNVNPKMEDMSPSQKRKAAEKTAEAIVTTYAQVIPPIFKKISSFNIPKLQREAMRDEINLNMQIDNDGTTVIKYVEGFNSEVETAFTVTEEMQNEIKEPLIEVLLENNLALTPTQRLLLAVGGQIVSFTVAAIQLVNQKKQSIEAFKEFYKQNSNNSNKGNTYTPPPPPPQQPSSNSSNNSTNNDDEKMVVMGDESKVDDVNYTEVKPDKVKNPIKMDDVIEVKAEEIPDDII